MSIYVVFFATNARFFAFFAYGKAIAEFAELFSRAACSRLDKRRKKLYNTICTQMHLYGAAKVSTGVLRYDKRGGQDNPVKMSNLNNKRQQYCCSCSVSCDAALTPPVPRERTTTPAVRQISSEHEPRVAPVSVMHQGATKSGSLSVGVRMREA